MCSSTEPTIGLDVIAKDKIRAFIQEMNRDGVTFILTTHDLDDVERLAQRVIVINHGSIVFDDGISALRQHFGAKKIITASCAAPCFVSTEGGVSALPSGVSLLSRLSESDVVLECDTSVMDLPSLIRLVSETFGLRDLAVEDIPIETVIKELYAKGIKKTDRLCRSVFIEVRQGELLRSPTSSRLFQAALAAFAAVPGGSSRLARRRHVNSLAGE